MRDVQRQFSNSLCLAISRGFSPHRSTLHSYERHDAEALFTTRIIDRRSRKRSRLRWHGPLVAIIEGSKAETTRPRPGRGIETKESLVQMDAALTLCSWVSLVLGNRARYISQTIPYIQRWISKCSEMKFRQTRDYSEPISKINFKWWMSINAMILR